MSLHDISWEAKTENKVNELNRVSVVKSQQNSV